MHEEQWCSSLPKVSLSPNIPFAHFCFRTRVLHLEFFGIPKCPCRFSLLFNDHLVSLSQPTSARMPFKTILQLPFHNCRIVRLPLSLKKECPKTIAVVFFRKAPEVKPFFITTSVCESSVQHIPEDHDPPKHFCALSKASAAGKACVHLVLDSKKSLTWLRFTNSVLSSCIDVLKIAHLEAIVYFAPNAHRS